MQLDAESQQALSWPNNNCAESKKKGRAVFQEKIMNRKVLLLGTSSSSRSGNWAVPIPPPVSG